MSLTRRFVCAAVLAVTIGTMPTTAQEFPAKPLRLVVTFAPGGSSDIVARAISAPLQEKLGQAVVVDNKPGAGGSIGASEVARAAPDGYTLMMSNTTPISLAPPMLDNPTYNPLTSFSHVSLIATVPDVIMVHPDVPAKTVKELIEWIKNRKETTFYGSGGIGSIGHILGETFKKDHGLNTEHVGFKGSSPMITDLLGGRLSFSFDTLPQNVPHIKSGKLRALAVSSRSRSDIAADIPTTTEAGIPTVIAENFIGISAPAGTPPAVQKKIYDAVQASLDDPNFVKRMSELGLTIRKMSQPDFGKFVEEQVKTWEPAVKASGAKLN